MLSLKVPLMVFRRVEEHLSDLCIKGKPWQIAIKLYMGTIWWLKKALNCHCMLDLDMSTRQVMAGVYTCTHPLLPPSRCPLLSYEHTASTQAGRHDFTNAVALISPARLRNSKQECKPPGLWRFTTLCDHHKVFLKERKSPWPIKKNAWKFDRVMCVFLHSQC